MDSAGVYMCTASNDVGEENCTIDVTMERKCWGGEPCTAHLTPNCHSDGWLLFLTTDGKIFSPGAPALVATGHPLFTNSCVSLSH